MALMDKIKALLKGRKNEIKGGVDNAGETARAKAPDKYDDKIDMATDKTKDAIDKLPD